MTAFTWGDYLEIARRLRGKDFGNLSEAALRSAVSRAYYAAFNHARAWSLKQTHPPFYSSNGDVHQEVIDYFKKCSYKTISDELTSLRRSRRRCDYDQSVTNLIKMADESITQSNRIISILHE